MKLIYKVTYYKTVPNQIRGEGFTRVVIEVAFVACSDVKSIFKYFDKLKSVEYICEVTQEM